jgi:hypothetical protein
MKMPDFCAVAPCSLVEVYLMMEAESTFETSVKLYQTTWRNGPEDSHLQTQKYLLNFFLKQFDHDIP